VSEPSLPEKIVAVHDVLTTAKVSHAFGGALALAYYAEPRATVDIDLNVFLAPAEHPRLLALLAPLGVGDEVDPAALGRDGQARCWWGRTPIDLFFAHDEIHVAMREAIRTVPFGDDRIPILAPEHLLVCKAVFNRPKDWLDIEQVLVAVGDLDVAEIDRWLERLVGADDPRKERFDGLSAPDA
jgi:hypothetical protein